MDKENLWVQSEDFYAARSIEVKVQHQQIHFRAVLSPNQTITEIPILDLLHQSLASIVG